MDWTGQTLDSGLLVLYRGSHIQSVVPAAFECSLEHIESTTPFQLETESVDRESIVPEKDPFQLWLIHGSKGQLQGFLTQQLGALCFASTSQLSDFIQGRNELVRFHVACTAGAPACGSKNARGYRTVFRQPT